MARESFRPGDRTKSGHNKATEWVALGKCEVIHMTDKAVLLEMHPSGEELWVPRSVCEGGTILDLGDTDVRVHRWFADKNDLPT
jgi:hypothetical protein